MVAFGGRVDDLESFLIEERIPDGWESRILLPMGMTFITFNVTILKLERSIDEDKYIAERKAAAEANPPKIPEGTVTALDTLL